MTSNPTVLIERWNGTTWSTQTGATPSGSTSSALSGVACASTTSCVAVGYAVNSSGVTVPLAEHWDGPTWTVKTTIVPTGATDSTLNAVSCTSSSACTAVGTYSDGTNQHAFIERYTGTSWTSQTAGTPPTGSTDTTLTGVSCTTATACVAVGSSTDATGTYTLSQTWAGSSWSTVRPVNPSGSTLVSMSAVSCTTSSSNCTGVGDFATFGANLAERYNGTAWSLQTTSTPSGSLAYNAGVSCTTTTACQAAGAKNDSTTGVATTYAEAWNGTTWTSQTIPNPAAAANAYLLGVSCTSAAACTAVGYYVDSTSGNLVTIAERFA